MLRLALAVLLLPAVAAADEASLVREDVEPTVAIGAVERLQLALGGLVQVHAAPYVGDDALTEDGDPASAPGFRVRRARLGAEARRDDLALLVAVNPVPDAEDPDVLSDAKLTWAAHRLARFAIGTTKAPFARAALRSSALLVGLERPLSASALTPRRRLGLTIEGGVGPARWLAGVLNGSEGYAGGNRDGGVLAGGRAEVDVVEGWLTLGASGLGHHGPATRGFSASADVLVTFEGGRLLVEALCDRAEPLGDPAAAPTLADRLERCGAYAEASWMFPWNQLQPAARVEVYDDDRAVKDSGDAVLVDVGVNAGFLPPWGRAQLHYLARRERHGAARANDALVLALQGRF